LLKAFFFFCESQDYELYQKRHVFNVTTGLFDSGFSDPASKRLVLQFLQKAATIPPVIGLMIKSNGFIAWLHQNISQESAASEQTLPTCLDLLASVLRACFSQRGLLTPAIMDQLSTVLSSLIHQLDLVPNVNPVWAQNVFARVLAFASDLSWISLERYKGEISVINAGQLLRLVRKHAEFSAKFWSAASLKVAQRKQQRDQEGGSSDLASLELDQRVLRGLLSFHFYLANLLWFHSLL